MTLAEIVARIRAECPSFAHVDDFATSTLDFDLPAAIVEPLKRDASPALFTDAHVQQVDLVFGVYILFERKLDAPQLGWDALCAELQLGLVGWATTPYEAPVSYAGGQVARWKEQYVCWREDFSTNFELRR